MRAARILAVDDEPMNLEILARYLEGKGHTVAGAGDCDEALAALRAGRFDLILLDLVLPGRTGLQGLPEFAALTRAPIHIMTGHSDPETRKDSLLLGAAGFLGKPLDLAAVCALIDALPERTPGA
jgi:DNA-binding response OmpR family regulator